MNNEWNWIGKEAFVAALSNEISNFIFGCH